MAGDAAGTEIEPITRDARASEVVREGSRGIFERSTVKKIEKLATGNAVLCDALRGDASTVARGLNASAARLTEVGAAGIHRNAGPSDLGAGVNFDVPQARGD